MTRIHPKPDLDCESAPGTSVDPNENTVLTSSPRETNVPFADGDYNPTPTCAPPEHSQLFQNTPLSSYRLTFGGVKEANRLWVDGLHIFGWPCTSLTAIRVFQLLAVNLLTLVLPWIPFVQEGIQELPQWGTVLAVGIHCVLYLAEENTLFNFPDTQRISQLNYAIFMGSLYAACEVYCGLVFSVYVSQLAVSLILLILSVIFLADHWMKQKTTTGDVQLDEANKVKFEGVTRTETSETRLNVGPQLVFPIPEEYSMPGDFCRDSKHCGHGHSKHS